MDLRVKYVLGPELKEIRERLNLTQKEAAEEAGVAYRTWQLWESDTEVMPRAKQRRALVAWLQSKETEVAA
jgi:transcriptional regulator with XRE-family HTH domain